MPRAETGGGWVATRARCEDERIRDASLRKALTESCCRCGCGSDTRDNLNFDTKISGGHELLSGAAEDGCVP